MTTVASNLVLRQLLLATILNHLAPRRASQTELAKLLGIPQSRFSRLANGHIEDFSLDALVLLAEKLDLQVHLSVSVKTSR